MTYAQLFAACPEATRERLTLRYGHDLGEWPQDAWEKIVQVLGDQRESAWFNPDDRRENTLQLTIKSKPDCDWQLAAENIGCLKGRVVVEMASADRMRGVLFMPDNVADNLRPDIGTVIAKGDDVPLQLGDVVAVRGYDGTWRENFAAGDYIAKDQVRFYGVFVEWGCYGEPQASSWWESVIAVLGDKMEIKEVLGDMVLVKRDPVLEEVGGVFLTEDQEYRTNAGTVVKVGPGKPGKDGKFVTTTVQVGQRVVYHPEGMLDIDSIDGDRDLCLMPEGSIEAVLAPQTQITGIRQRGVLAVAA